MSDLTATMARVADIAGSLRSLGGAAAWATSAARSSSAGPRTASSPSSTTTSSGGTSTVATSSEAFASVLGGATGAAAGTGAKASAATSVSSTSGSKRAATGSGADRRVDGDAVVADAKRYLGVRYRWGGTDPATGLDCSGLTQRVFADLGITIPRTVAQQQHAGSAVSSLAQARPGDLLVFGTHHIGIYVGDGKMLHAPHAGDVVKIAKIYDPPTRIRRVAGGTAAGAEAAAGTSYARPTSLRSSGSSGSTAYDDLFTAATRRYHLPAGLLKAVARAESSFNPRAHSPAGAIGLMQIMPGTARELGVDPRDPAEAVDGAARLLRSHLGRFGSVRLAVAAYNAGPGAVRRYDGVPPYAETRTYVERVLAGMGRDTA